MSSDEAIIDKVEELKSQGNECFQKNKVDDAIEKYTAALVELRRLPPSSSSFMLQATLLSNRAACRLKQESWKSSMEDCTSALEVLDKAASDDTATAIRVKLLYRRAKARFMISHNDSSSNEVLNDAAKDLLTLLSIEKENSQASTLLQAIRTKHGIQQQNHTPIAKTLDTIATSPDYEDKSHHLKVLLGLLTNDLKSASKELGRRNGVSLLIKYVASEHELSPEAIKSRTLALQVLSCACSYPPFCRTYCGPNHLNQQDLAHLVSEECINPDRTSVAVAALSVMLRLVLHLDRDDENQDISSKTLVDGHAICRATVAALDSGEQNVTRAVLDVLSSWTTNDREGLVHAAVVDAGSSSAADSELPHKATEQEIRSMKPRELATYRKRQHARQERDKEWAKSRSLLFCDQETGGLASLLQCSTSCSHHGLRREIGLVMGRLMSSINDEPDIKAVVAPILGCSNVNEESKEDGRLTIEEIHSDDEEEEGCVQTVEEEAKENDRLEPMMEKGVLTLSLLLGKPDLGVWSLQTGWSDGQGLSELRKMMLSNDSQAMFIAAEILSGAASVEKARPLISPLMDSRAFQNLLESTEKEIQSGAASAIAKIGLADKKMSDDEGEVMGLLEVAVHLLSDKSDEETTNELLAKASKVPTQSSGTASSQGAATAVERGIELLSYLSSKTQVKEELAHGFRVPNAPYTALEQLVEIASEPGAGDSISAYGLATIFALIPVSIETLRREAFADKDISAEQYDELQALAKTQEEKEMEKKKEPDDTREAVQERIMKMANSNVPRAAVKLMEGASELAVEQIVLAMNRMAIEESVRGAMIQQGVLSSFMKLEKGGDEDPSETGKRTLRESRQCIAKLLVTTNPSLLTASQRMGAIKPLILLIHDHDAKSLQQFEALLAVTNLASVGDETKNRIISERGISVLGYAMFSDHDMVRCAATEAMCNLVPHPEMMKHLEDPEKLKLWVAFAADFEVNYECARAAVGCLAMASQKPEVATTLTGLSSFKDMTMSLLESGKLELMHRVLVMILNLIDHGDKCRAAVIATGAVAFCALYVDSFHDEHKAQDLNFTDADKGLMKITVDLAKEIVKQCE